MKKIFKKNQIVISALAVMIAVAGYLTMAGRGGSGGDDAAAVTQAGYETYVQGDGSISPEDILAENQNVDVNATEEIQASTEAGSATSEPTSEAAGNAETKEFVDVDSLDYDITNPGEAVLANGLTVSDYVAQIKLDREQNRGKNRESFVNIIDNEAVSSEEKQEAIQKMLTLTETVDKENAAEIQLQAKGFDESIVYIQNGQVNVTICKENLTDAEKAQIEDIVKRNTQMGIENIVISCMELGS